MPIILTQSPQDNIRYVACPNSFLTGISVAQQGDIAARIPIAQDIRSIYNIGGFFNGSVNGGRIPAAEVGTFAIRESQLTGADNLNIGYECRRGANLIASDGLIQTAISTINGTPILGGDSRWCIYVGSEDKNVMVFSVEWVTDLPGQPETGNNLTTLLDLTKRLPSLIGQQGPYNLNGTEIEDIEGSTGIYAKGCLVTYEDPTTQDGAMMTALGV